MKSVRQSPLQATAVFLPKNAGKSLRSQVVLGSPSAGCQDVGVCRVIPADLQVSVSCPVAIAWLSQTETGKIRFSFLKSSIPENLMHKHFGWGLFQVIECFGLPEFICRGLKVGKCTIDPGIYPVFVRQDRIIVDF